jgi:pSer/pThr/pTyr-binding forkhead associated (FHA) protein/NADPH-dependent 2,4-dienoyl-CoA reductase/sulfur reductase-like enzyme
VTRHVIIGDGGAGTTAAYFIRQADPTAQIEIYSDDPNAAYYRAALTNYLMGELREAQLFAVPPDFYHANNVKRALGRVMAVDDRNSRLTIANGSQVAYDQLLIAAGARPNPPDFQGADLAGVMTMRTLQDARAVMDMAASNRLRRAVIVGGGPLGIEWVQSLLHHQVQVTYLLRGEMFFERALDQTASDLVISRLRAEGVDVRTSEEIDEALGGRDGRLRAVRLKNSGQEIECQLVGAAIGIRPNIDFLEGSSIDIAADQKRGIAQGIKVDEYMRTNTRNVYAAGDILYRTLGLWEPARLQGRVAGRNMAGGSETYRQGAYYNATRLYDLDFAGVGEVTEKPGDQVLVDFPKGSGQVAYRKLIIRDGKLVGAIMLGQRKERVRKYGLHYRKLIDSGMDVSAVEKVLLDSSFDLTAWMDTQKMTDQIDTVRGMTALASVASIADIRKSNQTLKISLADMPKIPKAVLHFDGANIPLKGFMEIGRRTTNDLVLDDLEVSGHHAQIRWDGSAYVLKDLKSRNGTFLNGVKIGAPSALPDGATIRMGEKQLRFQFVLAAAPAEKRPISSAGLPVAAEKTPVTAAVPTSSLVGYLQLGEQQIDLRTSGLSIGRGKQTDVMLDDPTVSYQHAQIVCQGDVPYLRDLGSSNGTYVNGELVSVPHRLQSGDVIKLGNTSLTFHAEPVSGTVPVKREDPVPANVSLILRAVAAAGGSFTISQSPTIIGRHPNSQIVLNDETVGRQHAIFRKEGAKWLVEDLGSSNGTWINNKRIEANRPYPLQAADRLRLGDTLLEVGYHAD